VGRWKGTAHTARMATHCGWFQNVLLVVQGKAQAALPDSAVSKQLDEQIQALQDTPAQFTPSWKLRCFVVNGMYMQVLLLLSNYIRQFLSCTSGMYIRWCASFHYLKGHRSVMWQLSSS
jgi:hypothetical protein